MFKFSFLTKTLSPLNFLWTYLSITGFEAVDGDGGVDAHMRLSPISRAGRLGDTKDLAASAASLLLVRYCHGVAPRVNIGGGGGTGLGSLEHLGTGEYNPT